MAAKNSKGAKKAGSVFKNELFGIVLIFLGIMILYFSFVKDSGTVGNLVKLIGVFLFGIFGNVGLGLVCVFVGGYMFLSFNSFEDNKGVLYSFGLVFNFSVAVQLMSTDMFSELPWYDPKLYVSVYEMGTDGGILGLLFSRLFSSLLSKQGAWLLLVFATLVFIFLIFKDKMFSYASTKNEIKEKEKKQREKEKIEEMNARSKEKLKREKEKRQLKQANQELKLQQKQKPVLLANPYDKPKEEIKSVTEDVEKDKKKSKSRSFKDMFSKEEDKKKEKEITIVEKKIIKKENDLKDKKVNNDKKVSSEDMYVFPPLDLLKNPDENQNGNEKREILDNAKLLEETLENFSIGATVTQINVGPTVTRYELQLQPGIRVSKVLSLSDDIALSLAAQRVRIEAPIPGKSAIGIEVPNKKTSLVRFKELAESDEFINSKSNLSVGLGKKISGDLLVIDLAKMPHLLIAGATGSGKSVCINTIISSILYHSSPENVKMILIDPKTVELAPYNGIPHLLIPVVTDPEKAAGALNWAVRQMKDRYALFAKERVRNIQGYNEKAERTGEEKLPEIVIIIDELADLMMVCASQVESAICRLAQLARAAGIYLVLATQRPSVDVITGLIKANIPSRISFAVSSQVDSRTILDTAGAEKLLGKGDMLYLPGDANQPLRAQGAFLTDEEVEKIVNFLKKEKETTYDEEIIEEITSAKPENGNGGSHINGEEDDDDILLNDAIELAFAQGQISTSLIQRRFKIGYARAGRIIDQMERKGIISGPEGSKPRKLLVKSEDFYAEKLQKEEE